MLADLVQPYPHVFLRTVSVLLGTLLFASSVAAQSNDPAPPPGQTTHACAQSTPGPEIDPIAGDQVGRDSLSCLPSSRHLGAAMDVWFNRVISQQVGDGGMAFFDPVRLSSHGRSWRQTRFHLNGIDITDPARPGEPLFELPYGAWDGVAYRSLWTARPGVDMSFQAEAPDRWRLTGATGQDVGGRAWIPSDLFDRGSATEYGATDERRRLRTVEELFAERAWQLGETARLRLVGAFVEHEHRYPTLRSNDGSNVVYEREIIRHLAGLSSLPVWITESSTAGPERHLDWVTTVYDEISETLGNVERIFYYDLFDFFPEQFRLFSLSDDETAGVALLPESTRLLDHFSSRVDHVMDGTSRTPYEALIPDITAYFPTAEDHLVIESVDLSQGSR